MIELKAIAAVSLNGVIGKNGDLPWHIPGELKWFKKITMGHVIVMGRKTWESLPGSLPGRENWILSRSNFNAENAQVFNSFEDIEKKGEKRPFLLLGVEKFIRIFLPHCSELFLTEVNRTIENGDAFFPSFQRKNLGRLKG